MKRVKLNGGMREISIAGVRQVADEDGGFTVPDELSVELLRIYGGEQVPGLEELQARCEAIDKTVRETETQLEAYLRQQESAHAALAAYVEKTTKPAPVVVPPPKPPQSAGAQGNGRR